jgi:hypothetical protein
MLVESAIPLEHSAELSNNYCPPSEFLDNLMHKYSWALLIPRIDTPPTFLLAQVFSILHH